MTNKQKEMYKQKNNIIYIVHIHIIRHYNYGFQLHYFSSINMDGAAEEWSTETSVKTNTQSTQQSRISVSDVVMHKLVLTRF